MMAELILGLIRANLAAAAAVVVVLILRKPVRAHFGAHLAYMLWLIVPLVAAASLLPGRPADEATSQVNALAAAVQAWSVHALSPETTLTLFSIWLRGAAVIALLIMLGQWRFLKKAAQGQAGPAIIGVLHPRIVMPADFETRFTPHEQAVIRVHERAHIARHDARANALVGLLQCLCWFNPLVHVAAALIRIDQELACDATVIERLPGERRRYAQAMLKTQLGGAALPLGCRWLAHPLEDRVAMLAQPMPGPLARAVGLGAVSLIGLTAAAAVWTVHPPQPAPPPADPPVLFMNLNHP
ncbi:hypothetical protein BH11PSE2_BH11PSE2_18990 [soil metagenome]